VNKIGTVRRGNPTTIRGSAHDAGGIKSARVYFGDGSSAAARLSKSGAFTVRHIYGRVGTYHVRLTVRDRSGHTTTVRATAKVRRR
jgi:hypothetical protein